MCKPGFLSHACLLTEMQDATCPAASLPDGVRQREPEPFNPYRHTAYIALCTVLTLR